jgi:hypothetical protein
MAVNNLNTPGVGIQPSLIDAKGDLLVGTANDAIDRLGVTGTTGAVLTADAGETTGLKWAAAGSVGGLVHINTTTFSAVAAQSINDVFTSTYDNYKVIISFHLGSGVVTNLRLRASGSDNSASNYQYASARAGSNAAAQNIGGVNQNTILATYGLGGTSEQVTLTFDAINPNLAKATNLVGNSFGADGAGASNYSGGSFTAQHTSTSQFDGFTLYPASGNITGTIRVYGYKN